METVPRALGFVYVSSGSYIYIFYVVVEGGFYGGIID